MNNDLSINFSKILEDIKKFRFLSILVILFFFIYICLDIYKDFQKKSEYYTEVKISPISYSDVEDLNKIIYSIEKFNEKCLYIWDAIQETMYYQKTIQLDEDVEQSILKLNSPNNSGCENNVRINSFQNFDSSYLVRKFITHLTFLINDNEIVAELSNNVDTSNLIDQTSYIAKMKTTDSKKYLDFLAIIDKAEIEFNIAIQDKFTSSLNSIIANNEINLFNLKKISPDNVVYQLRDKIFIEDSKIKETLNSIKNIKSINKRIISKNIEISNKPQLITVTLQLIIYFIIALAFSLILSLILGGIARAIRDQQNS